MFSSSESISSLASQQAIPSTSSPPLTSSSPDRPAVKGGASVKWTHPGGVDLSVFDILNIFRRRWFLSRTNLMANVVSAQKAEDGNISWVEFTPPFHSHLIKCAVALVPHPVHVVKRVMFVFILELLNGVGTSAFFDLQKGGCKANNAQKEKRRLVRKRSRAAKRERDREAVKAAKLPPHERQCKACGRKFESHKTACKHQCPVAKVESVRKEAAVRTAAQVAPAAPPIKPAAQIPPRAPTAPSNSNPQPVVTGDSRARLIPLDRLRGRSAFSDRAQ
jgi:predicted RNA-binding Zn-ribbon protein involved in translation (DUF1610 family)